MTYDELFLLRQQFFGAIQMYLSQHPDEINTLEKRLALDALQCQNHTAMDAIQQHTSFIREVGDYILTKMTCAQPKEFLTAREVSNLLGISLSYLYKLTMQNEIPHYKPMGKLCYFNYEELMNWITKSDNKPTKKSKQQ